MTLMVILLPVFFVCLSFITRRATAEFDLTEAPKMFLCEYQWTVMAQQTVHPMPGVTNLVQVGIDMSLDECRARCVRDKLCAFVVFDRTGVKHCVHVQHATWGVTNDDNLDFHLIKRNYFDDDVLEAYVKYNENCDLEVFQQLTKKKQAIKDFKSESSRKIKDIEEDTRKLLNEMQNCDILVNKVKKEGDDANKIENTEASKLENLEIYNKHLENEIKTCDETLIKTKKTSVLNKALELELRNKIKNLEEINLKDKQSNDRRLNQLKKKQTEAIERLEIDSANAIEKMRKDFFNYHHKEKAQLLKISFRLYELLQGRDYIDPWNSQPEIY